MRKIDERTWCQVVEYIARERPDVVQVNSVDGLDCLRSYLLPSGELVARMTVYESNTEKEGNLCERLFEANEEMLAGSKFIYIPTQEECDYWDDPAEPERDICDLIAQKESELRGEA